MDKTLKPSPISRRESLKRAAGILALGLGAPVTALAATDDDGAIDFRLSFWKVENQREPFHTIRVSRRDAQRLGYAGGTMGDEGAMAYIKIDTVDGESVRTVGTWYHKDDIGR